MYARTFFIIILLYIYLRLRILRQLSVVCRSNFDLLSLFWLSFDPCFNQGQLNLQYFQVQPPNSSPLNPYPAYPCFLAYLTLQLVLHPLSPLLFVP
jgi:hypothetical protein